jgi:pimeloyl-ACP methyl ester carboxylesterase
MNPSTQTEAMPAVPAIAKVDGVEDCTAEINGVRWRYLRAGTGPVLLVVHGFTAYSFSWRFVIGELAQHYSVYAVDLPGCGFSQRCPELPGTLASDAEHLLSFMNYQGIERCDILGTSRGGGTAIALAGLLAERGELGRIGRLVLSAPINPWSRYQLMTVRLLRNRAGRAYLVQIESRLHLLLKHFFKTLYAAPARIPADSLAGYNAGLEPAGSYEHIWKIIRSWMNDLKRIESVLPVVGSIPTLLLWGDRDAAVDPASAEELHHRWTNSAVHIMENMGHMPYEEVPGEFNRIMLDFLLRDKPSTPLANEASAVVAGNYSEPRRA